MSFDAQRLIQVGGKEWKRDRRHRIYIENIASWYGLKWETASRTGALISATLDGEPVDLSVARDLLVRLKGIKIWYDLAKHEFQWRDAPDIRRIAERVVSALEKALPSEQVLDPSRVYDYGGSFHVEASRELDLARGSGDPGAMARARAKLALVKPRPTSLMMAAKKPEASRRRSVRRPPLLELVPHPVQGFPRDVGDGDGDDVFAVPEKARRAREVGRRFEL